MSGPIASKNLFELLGNDDEGSETPTAPVKTVTKTSTSTAKASADGSKPAALQSRAGFPSSQRSFRDGGVGRAANQSKSTEPRTEERPRGGRGARGRGGAGATRHRAADDRHAKNIAPGSEKQAAQSWGAPDGDAELKDEQAGDAIAENEKNDAEAEDAEAEPKEPEVKQITLDAYLAQRDTAELNSTLSLRTVDKPSDLRVVEKEETEDFIAGSGGKSVKSKARKVKETIKWDDSAREEPSTRGGRGGFRGGDRGDRGERRGDFREGRGGGRGGRGDGPRGGAPRGGPRGGAPHRGGPPRGGRGAASTPKVNDQSEFPALG